MNEPQLSAETREDILDLVDPKVPYSHFVRVLEKYTQEVIATALEEERAKVLSEVEDWINQLPDWQWRVTREALLAKLNQLKGSDAH